MKKFTAALFVVGLLSVASPMPDLSFAGDCAIGGQATNTCPNKFVSGYTGYSRTLNGMTVRMDAYASAYHRSTTGIATHTAYVSNGHWYVGAQRTAGTKNTIRNMALRVTADIDATIVGFSGVDVSWGSAGISLATSNSSMSCYSPQDMNHPSSSATNQRRYEVRTVSGTDFCKVKICGLTSISCTFKTFTVKVSGYVNLDKSTTTVEAQPVSASKSRSLN